MTGAELRQQAILVALVALLGVLLLYPLWLTIEGALRTRDGTGWTAYHVLSVFRDPVLREGLRNAFLIATCTTILATLIATPLALLGARTRFPGQGILSALILLPLILPPFVGAIGVRHLLGRFGSVNAALLDLGLISQPIDF